MKRSTVLLVALALGCTPPHVESDHAPGEPRRGVAVFASSGSLYAALAELVLEPIAEGARVYSVAVPENPAAETLEGHHARELLREAAESSAEERAVLEGARLLSANVAAFEAPDGTTRVLVTSELEGEGERRHRELREGVVEPAHRERRARVRWLGPPRALAPADFSRK
jgi:hypothetical protein